jgi:hypothetical protein
MEKFAGCCAGGIDLYLERRKMEDNNFMNSDNQCEPPDQGDLYPKNVFKQKDSREKQQGKFWGK